MIVIYINRQNSSYMKLTSNSLTLGKDSLELKIQPHSFHFTKFKIITVEFQFLTEIGENEHFILNFPFSNRKWLFA